MNAINFSASNLGCSITGTTSDQSGQATSKEWNEDLYATLIPSELTLQKSESPSETLASQQLRTRNVRLEAWLHHPQYALTRLLRDPSFSLKLRELKDGGTQLVVTETRAARLIPPATQVWSFSSASLLPTRVDYSIVNPKHSSLYLQRSIEYDGFREFEGIMSPTQEILRTGSNLVRQRTINNVSCAPLQQQ